MIDIFELGKIPLRNALDEFRQCFLVENQSNRTMSDIIDSFYSPSQGMEFGNYGDSAWGNIDPSLENTFERATSGILSYHLSMSERFFALGRLIEDNDKLDEAEVAQALEDRTDKIHEVIQEPENFASMAAAVREKAAKGIAAKVIEPNETKLANIEYYPFSQIALGTTNGKVLDIYGICEELNDFQARERFPKPFMDKDFWMERNISGIFSSDKRKYYRFNLPLPAFRLHLLDFVRRDLTPPMDKKFVDLILGKKVDRSFPQWVDVWFSDEKVFSLDIKDYRPIMVNKATPPYSVMNFARGQAEKSLPLLMALTHAMEISVQAFDKTYNPSVTVADEMEKLGMNLAGGGISIKESGTDGPEYFSLNADMRAIIEYRQYMQGLYERIHYLDVFELVHKNRMNQKEVDIRDNDDYRKYILYLTQDAADDLSPLVLGLNHMVHKTVKRDKLSGLKLRARYVSEIAFSNKNTIFNKIARHTELARGIGEIGLMDSPVNDVVDLTGYYEYNMLRAGEGRVLREENERNSRRAIRLSREKVRDAKENSDAIAENQRAFNEISGAPRQEG